MTEIGQDEKIAIIGGYPPPYGGVGVSLQRVIPYLDKSGLDYVVYNTGPSKTNHPTIKDVGWSLSWALKMVVKSRHKVIQFSTSRWWVRLFAALLNMTTRSKVIIYARGYSLPNSYFRGNFLKKMLVKKTLQHTEVVLATNPALGERIAEIGFPKEKIKVVPAFVPPLKPPVVDDLPESVREFCQGKSPILGANGGYVLIDGQDVYGLRILEQLTKNLLPKFPNLGLVVYLREGADKDKEHFLGLLEEVQRAPLKDHLMFYESAGEFCPFFSICDVFLRPTTTDGDSVSVREALYACVPVVASDVIPRPEGCRIYKLGHQGEFVREVTKVLENLDEEKACIKKLPYYNNADKLIEIYRLLLD